MSKYTFLNKWHRKMKRKVSDLTRYWERKEYRILRYSKIYDSETYSDLINDVDRMFQLLVNVWHTTKVFYYDLHNLNRPYLQAYMYFVNKIGWDKEYECEDIYPTQLLRDIVDGLKTSIIRLQRISQVAGMPHHDLFIYSKLLLWTYQLEEHILSLTYYNIGNLKKRLLEKTN